MSPLTLYALIMHSVQWGINPVKNITLLFSAKPPLTSATRLVKTAHILVFQETPPPPLKI